MRQDPVSIGENIDCMEFMARYPDKYFELGIVDPPYGIGVNSMNYTTSGSVRTRGNAKANRRDYRKKQEWDVLPDEKYFKELFRVSKSQIIWGGNYFNESLPSSKSFIVWDKRVNDSMTNDFADCEYAWASKGLGVGRMFRYVWNGMIQGDMKNKEDRFHPTQKPVALYKWLLNNYAKSGDKILDTHLGSGSSRIAAFDLGFDFYSCELDKDYFQAQEKRFQEFASQQRMF
jgi:site-specific DNA-methyltransferase (adenine-specific)